MIEKRRFILGDEWLYYKLYGGKRMADEVLTEVIKPLTEELLEGKWIDQWFFIRYSDPNGHIRFRLHCPNKAYLGTVILKVNEELQTYVTKDCLWKIQVDTYEREVERYGAKTMEVSEILFFYDSQFIVNILDRVEDDELLFLVALRSIDGLLNVFQFDLEQKIAFTTRYFEAYKKEFNADKRLNKQLHKKYAVLKQSIFSFMKSPPKEYNPLLMLFSDKEKQLKIIAKEVMKCFPQETLSLESFLGSHIHMMVNRMFRDKQRLYELLCYSCMNRFYKFEKSTK